MNQIKWAERTGKLCDIFQRIKYIIVAVVVLGIRIVE